ncbi:RHS repeat-associated protein [Novosphingobium sp. 1529]|uniref:RHS repeat domain-containing protein n=1 Tax=Novosphingobium sp. 1529 TaxID=3156424 RepID=UPI003394426E
MKRLSVSRYAWYSCSVLSLVAALGVSHKAAAQAASSPFTTGYRYDAAGRITGEIKPSAQSGQGNGFVATRSTYDASGRLVNVESGYLSSWQSEAVAPATWSGFTIVKSVISTYDIKDRKIAEVVVASDRSVAAVQQFSYDGLDRVVCTVARMNKAAFPTVTAANTLSGGSLPTDACSQGSTGDAGPDRITRNVYDTANQLVQIRRAVGTSLEQAYATYSYSPNGKQVDVIDANGNRAQFIYDGFDRQTGWYFPSTSKPTNYSASAAATSTTTTNCAGQSIAVSTASSFGSAGSVNCADYEAYGYDANGNRTSLRKRDGSILTYSFDALNRVIKKIVPERSGLAATNTRDVYYGYDLQGHQLYARFDSASGEGIVNAWDGFGRQVSSTQAIDGVTRALGYQYDADSNRTRVTFPDGNYVSYGYDGLDRPLLIQRNGSAALASYSYDSAGRRVSFTNGTGGAIATSYGYDGASRLSSLTNTPQTSSYSSQYTFGYNPASQITSLTRSNNAFVFTGTYNVNRSYTANGLNQYTAAGSAGFTYDANGNLTSDGTNSYTYDVENRLVTVSGSATATLRYDPLGRLYEITGTSGTTRFLNDGDALVGEYNTAGTLLRRYAHGADIAADDPIAWYEGADFTATSERMLRPDWQGSIVLTTDSTGTTPIAINTYDEYGIPGADNKGRFQYTGQAWLGEVGMYYYKARIYSPTLGRFLQTDPIGYKDQVNLYAYVADDPVDRTDFSGLAGCVSGMAQADCATAMAAQAQARKDIAATQSALTGLTNERAAVANGSQKELSAGAKKTEGLLTKWFGDSSGSTVKSVQSSLRGIDNILADNGKKYNFTRQDIGKDFGKANPFTNIKLGNPFFSTSFRNQVVTVLHEPFHVMGNIFLPESYEGANRGWPTWYHLRNADDIAIFAYERGQ